MTEVRFKPTLSYMMHTRPSLERRFDPRVRVEMLVNQYIRDVPFRALAVDLSSTGLQLQKLVEPRIPLAGRVALEFEIPGTGEIVWACAESRFNASDDDFQMSGLTFTGMALKHERLLREFVLEKKFSRRLGRSWSRRPELPHILA